MWDGGGEKGFLGLYVGVERWARDLRWRHIWGGRIDNCEWFVVNCEVRERPFGIARVLG